MDTIHNKPQNRFVAVLFFLFLTFSFSFSSAAQDGEKLFKQNCAVCHSTGTNKIVGPGLEGVTKRVPSEAWMMKWIRNSAEVIASGDEYGKKIFAENGNVQMLQFPQFKDEEIKAIIAYVKNPPIEVVVAPVKPVTETKKQPINPLAIIFGIVAVLIIVIAILRRLRHSLKNLQNKNEGVGTETRYSAWQDFKNWMSCHKRTVALFTIFILLGLLQAGWDSLKSIGIYTGYQPAQPIAFSHKIHAGANAINCVYCHSGAEKSKTAGIPSVNVCMNCHKGISKGPVTGTAEIAKIYDAAGWDPAKGEYNKPQKPIQWVKVHVLADFVFFSHQQHVVVGKQACANCHGDLKTMTVAKQMQPLTMAWCINCHKQTEVPGMKDNPYYESLHKKLAEKFKGQPITVDKMGGIECAKCHY